MIYLTDSVGAQFRATNWTWTSAGVALTENIETWSNGTNEWLAYRHNGYVPIEFFVPHTYLRRSVIVEAS